jgi:hypothetical protein
LWYIEDVACGKRNNIGHTNSAREKSGGTSIQTMTAVPTAACETTASTAAAVAAAAVAVAAAAVAVAVAARINNYRCFAHEVLG